MTPIHSPSPLVRAVLVGSLSLLCVLGCSAIYHPEKTTVSSPPSSNAAGNAGRGRALFVRSCAHCHGEDAAGSGEDGDGPDLRRLAIGNARIAAIITKGIPQEMPSFAKKHGAADIRDITAYLRTLR